MDGSAIANAAQAAKLYGNTSKITLGDGDSAASNVGGVSFKDMLQEGVEQSIQTMRAGEQMSARAVIGDADLTDVVQAVTNAEMTLQTVVTIRDRMIQAYQDIMRLPI